MSNIFDKLMHMYIAFTYSFTDTFVTIKSFIRVIACQSLALYVVAYRMELRELRLPACDTWK